MRARGRVAHFDIPDFLTRAEAEAVLRVPNQRYPTGHRNYYLVRFLLGTGLRCSEALAVRVTDLDLDSRRLIVRNGKRRAREKKPRRRTVAISENLTQALREYLDTRSFPSEFLFSTRMGGALDTSYVRCALARYGYRAGLGRRVHPHLLRHTYGTWLYDEGVPLSTIQSQLGHDDLQTTAIYAHASGLRAARDVAPLDF